MEVIHDFQLPHGLTEDFNRNIHQRYSDGEINFFVRTDILKEIFIHYNLQINQRGRPKKIVDDNVAIQLLTERAKVDVGYHRIKDFTFPRR